MLTRTAVRTRNYFLLRTEVRADVCNAAERVSQNVELFWGFFGPVFGALAHEQANFPELISLPAGGFEFRFVPIRSGVDSLQENLIPVYSLMPHRGGAVYSSALSRLTSSVTMDACKRLAFQSLGVELQTANARKLRPRKADVSPRKDVKRSCSFILSSFFSESLNALVVRRTQV
jgi:hypothetical protein